MEYEEAIEWLKGKRSTCNLYYESAGADENAELLSTQADAAMMQQAYFVLKAHSENLIDNKEESCQTK
jgi:hypothetical protein